MRRTGNSARSRPTCTDRATRTTPIQVGELSSLWPTPDGSAPRGSSPRDRWTFAPCATTRHTRAIFELKWAPATLAKRRHSWRPRDRAGGCRGLRPVRGVAFEPDDDDAAGDDTAGNTGSSSSFDVAEMASVRCGGAGSAWRRAWTGARPTPAPAANTWSCRLAVVGATALSRGASRRPRGGGREECARPRGVGGGLRAPEVVARIERGRVHLHRRRRAAFRLGPCGASPPIRSRCKLRTHGAGVTCVRRPARSPSCHRVYDDKVRLWVAMYSPADEAATACCAGGTWRLRWHPERRAMACAAMGGGR